MNKRNWLLVVPIILVSVVLGLCFIIMPNKAYASWDHHVGDKNWMGIVREDGVTASFYCDMGRIASEYASSAQGAVYVIDYKFHEQHYFDYHGAWCADCASGQDGGTGFCGCPWPNTGWTTLNAGLNGAGQTLLYSYVITTNGKSAQDLYIPGGVTSIEFNKPESRQVVVYGELADNPTYDIKGKSLSDLFYNYGNNTLPYQRTTLQDKFTDTKTVKGTVWEITCMRYYRMDIWGNVYERAQETFSAKVAHNYEKTISYNAQSPSLTDEVYTPLNLNRGGYWDSKVTGDSRYVTNGDIAEWGINFNNTTNVGRIDGYATNAQDITDNSFIEGLDINSDMPFKLEFNNKCFGLDPNKNWANKPEVATGEDYIMHAGDTYAKGYNGKIPTGDDRFRCNVTIGGGVQDIGDQHLTSLYSYDDKEEYVTGSEYLYNLRDSYQTDPVYSNMFSARAIASGAFKTANFNKYSNYHNCWTITWSQGRFYEYGIHYEGTITKDGISNPNPGQGYQGVITGQQAQSGNPFSLYTDGLSNRGLYLYYADSNGETPLLVGKWRVKTLAGSATR